METVTSDCHLVDLKDDNVTVDDAYKCQLLADQLGCGEEKEGLGQELHLSLPDCLLNVDDEGIDAGSSSPLSSTSSSSSYCYDLDSPDLEGRDTPPFPTDSIEDAISTLQLIEAFMALDLRKKSEPPKGDEEDVKQIRDSVMERTDVAAADKNDIQPEECGTLFQLPKVQIKMLQHALKRLILLLRLDTQPADIRKMILHRLVSLLYLYLSRSGVEWFEKFASSDKSIKEFVFLLCRVTREKVHNPPMIIRPTRVAQLSDDGPQLMERSPTSQSRSAAYRNHPYTFGNVVPPRGQQQQPERGFIHQPYGANHSAHPSHFGGNNWSQNSFQPYYNEGRSQPFSAVNSGSPTPYNIPALLDDKEAVTLNQEDVDYFLKLVSDMPGLPALKGAVQECILQGVTELMEVPALHPINHVAKEDLPYSPSSSISSPAPSTSTGGGRTPIYPSSPPDLVPISPVASPAGPRHSKVPFREQVPPSWMMSPPLSLSPSRSALSPLSSTTGSPAPRSPLLLENTMLCMSLQSPCPPGTAREEILASLDPAEKERFMRQVAMSKMEALTEADSDGDTPLMVACANATYKYEALYALLERLKNSPNAEKMFTAVNHENKSALFLAAAENRPLVAGYLAETMASLGIRLNQSYEKGNTVIHHLAKYGDEYATVLEYLIRIKQPNGCPAFDLDARNHEGRSALHEAVLQHRHNVVDISYKAVINLLVKYGANAGLSDGTSGKTPAHIAVEKRDPELLRMLLTSCPSAANSSMYNDNRPLHSAATLSGVTEQQQLEMVNILLEFGADKACRNKANKLPVELVQQGREKVKGRLQARSRQQPGT